MGEEHLDQRPRPVAIAEAAPRQLEEAVVRGGETAGGARLVKSRGTRECAELDLQGLEVVVELERFDALADRAPVTGDDPRAVERLHGLGRKAHGEARPRIADGDRVEALADADAALRVHPAGEVEPDLEGIVRQRAQVGSLGGEVLGDGHAPAFDVAKVVEHGRPPRTAR